MAKKIAKKAVAKTRAQLLAGTSLAKAPPKVTVSAAPRRAADHDPKVAHRIRKDRNREEKARNEKAARRAWHRANDPAERAAEAARVARRDAFLARRAAEAAAAANSTGEPT